MQVESKRQSIAARTASKTKLSGISVQARDSDGRAIDSLFTLLYNDFRNLARRYLAREAHAHTLQPTALVNEAYLKLVDQKQVDWKNRSHVLAVGALAMRRVLVNHAIAARREKRGGAALRVTFDENVASAAQDFEVLALHEALHHLAKLNERHAKLVELRIFGGLGVSEVAEVLQVSVSTVEKDWRFCSAWLKNALRG